MIIEIPEPQVIGAVILAFVVGVFGMFVYSKIKALTGNKTQDPAYLSRLEYYERQLIDMKIRMDALDLENHEFETHNSDKVDPVFEKKMGKPAPKDSEEVKLEPTKPNPKPRMPNMGFEGVAEHVLGLITVKEMTSRDIQVTIGRSREHTSRLMKRLFEEGYVERNNKVRPFTYQITEKGKSKLANQEQPIPV
ncbi:MAG: winged helix DNA-binding protein [Candidatus Nitrosotenuis sp.]